MENQELEGKNDKGTALQIVDEKLIDESVKFINETVVKTMYKGSIEIGEYLLKNFFNDDIELASSKNPRKAVSYQELCKRPDLGVDSSQLSRMVRVASQERYFISNKLNSDALSYSHKIELIKLPNDKKKLRLVEKCIKEDLSCRKLSEQIASIKEKIRGKIDPSPMKLISSFDRLIEGTQIPTLISQPDKLESMRPKTRTEIREKTKDLLEKTKTITEDCEKLIETIDQIEEKVKLEKQNKENSAAEDNKVKASKGNTEEEELKKD